MNVLSLTWHFFIVGFGTQHKVLEHLRTEMLALKIKSVAERMGCCHVVMTSESHPPKVPCLLWPGEREVHVGV